MKLPSGRYSAKICYHEMRTNNAGNPELIFAVLPQQSDDPAYKLPEKYQPTPLSIYMVLTAATLGTPEKPGWVAETLAQLGFTTGELERLDPESDDPHSFVGRPVIILGTEDEYQGKARTRWSFVRYHDNKPVATSALKALGAAHGKTIASLAKKTPPPTTEPEPSPTDFFADQVPPSNGPYDKKSGRR